MNHSSYSNIEKRQAVLTLVTHLEWQSKSNREIVKRCGVSNKFVGKLRKELNLPVYGTQIQKIRNTLGTQTHHKCQDNKLADLSVNGTQIQKYKELMKTSSTKRIVHRKGTSYKMNTLSISKSQRTLAITASATRTQAPQPPKSN